MRTLFAPTRLFLGTAFILSASFCQADEGWFSGVDHLLLAPKLSGQGVQRIFYFDDLPSASAQDGSVATSVDYAQRLTLGYEGSQCGGAQIRWFTFDQDIDYSGVVNEGPIISLSGGVNLDVDAIDAELLQCGNFANFEWTATAGARYAQVSIREQDINFEALSDTIWFGSTGVEFEGAGPTISVAGSREFTGSGISLFASGRTALLFGDTELFSAFRSGGAYTNPDDMVQVWEIQAGTNIVRSMKNVDFITGIFWEAQRWDSDSNLLGDLGFHGFGVSTGIHY